MTASLWAFLGLVLLSTATILALGGAAVARIRGHGRPTRWLIAAATLALLYVGLTASAAFI